MSERYAKARLLPQKEARDERVRGLFNVLPTAEDAAFAIVLYHRVKCRLDVRGAVIFDASWLHAQCFLGYPDVTPERVAMWADALLEVGLFQSYDRSDIRYAWDPEFYHENPGLRFDLEDPIYPLPPGWEFEKLMPRDRPGRTPQLPDWAKPPSQNGHGAGLPPPAAMAERGGVAVHGASRTIAAAIDRMEGEIGDAVANELRAYALQFLEPDQRAERMLPAPTYHAVLATVHKWKELGGITYRGEWVSWSDARFATAFRHVSELVLQGRLNGHKYVEELLVDPHWPPKSGEKPAHAPEPDKKRTPTEAEAVAAASESASQFERARKKREARQEEAIQQWEEAVDRWIAENGGKAKYHELAKQVEGEIDPALKKIASAWEGAVRGKVRALAAAEAGIPKPD